MHCGGPACASGASPLEAMEGRVGNKGCVLHAPPCSRAGSGRSQGDGGTRNWTLTLLVRGDNVTVPVPWSMLPDEAAAMLPTSEGSWKRTRPDGRAPLSVRATDPEPDEIFRLNLLPEVVGKLETEIGGPPPSQWAGMPRPTTRVPSVRCATSESNRTLFAVDIPQAWGEEP